MAEPGMNEGDRPLPSVPLCPPPAPHVVIGQSPTTTSERPRILVVDDAPANLRLLVGGLGDVY